MIETVDEKKIANKMNKILLELKRPTPLNILIQVNTSHEDQKGGCMPKDVSDLVQHIIKECHALKFKGLMTIGSVDSSHKEGEPNPDFECLMRCKTALMNELQLDSCELSMGMSSDFIQAIIQGSTEVRIGSLIFGERH